MDFFEDFEGVFEEPEFFQPEEPDYDMENGVLDFDREDKESEEEISDSEDAQETDEIEKLFEEAEVPAYKKPKQAAPKKAKKQAAPKEKKEETKVKLEKPEKKKDPKPAPRDPEEPKAEESKVDESRPKEPEQPKPEPPKPEESGNNRGEAEKASSESRPKFNMEFDESKVFQKTECIQEADVEVIEEQPEEDQIEYIEPPKRIFRKAMVFAAMLAIMIGVPLIIAFAGKTKKQGIILPVQPSKQETEGVQTVFYDAKDTSTETITNSIASARFANLDELTLYIDSNTGTLLSNETQMVNMLSAGMITTDVFGKNLSDYISQANELNHLLLVNEKTYEREGKLEVYNQLVENMNTLLVYGDAALYNGTYNFR